MSVEIENRMALLEAELDRLVRVVAEEFNAEQIILFGSMADARRRVDEWTDLDLVVVAETKLPFHRRAGEILRRARPEVGVDVFAYTPPEWERMKAESPFIKEDVLGKGRVVYERPRQPVAHVFGRGSSDGRTRPRRTSVEPNLLPPASQSAEKILKALIAEGGENTPRTHRLTDLMSLLGGRVREEVGEDLRSLEGFYIPTRYPDAVPGTLPEGLPEEEDARASLASAREVSRVVREFLGLGSS